MESCAVAKNLLTRARMENVGSRLERKCGTNRSLASRSIPRLRIFTEKHFAFDQRLDFLRRRAFERLSKLARNSVGDFLKSFLKTRLNCDND